MVSPSIPNGIYRIIKISPNKLPMLSTKNHCDPKSSTIHKAARSKKQCDPKSRAINWITNSAAQKMQHATAEPPKIALSTKKQHDPSIQLHSIEHPHPPSPYSSYNSIQLQILSLAPYSSPVRFLSCPYYHPRHPPSPLKLIISSPSLPYICSHSFSSLIKTL